ncbi:protein of unknown function [Streptomyces murinus]
MRADRLRGQGPRPRSVALAGDLQRGRAGAGPLLAKFQEKFGRRLPGRGVPALLRPGRGDPAGHRDGRRQRAGDHHGRRRSAGPGEFVPVAAGDGPRELVGSGTVDRSRVRIVDAGTGAALPDARVGEVWVRGESVAQGYWGRPDLNAEVFDQRLDGETGFFRTGDLGVIHDGELYITGRLGSSAGASRTTSNRPCARSTRGSPPVPARCSPWTPRGLGRGGPGDQAPRSDRTGALGRPSARSGCGDVAQGVRRCSPRRRDRLLPHRGPRRDPRRRAVHHRPPQGSTDHPRAQPLPARPRTDRALGRPAARHRCGAVLALDAPRTGDQAPRSDRGRLPRAGPGHPADPGA